MRPAHAIACSLAFFLSSCFLERESLNEPLDPVLVRHLQPGTTTAKQVVELLGAPAEVVELGKRSAYRYEHTVGKNALLFLLLVGLSNVDRRSDRLWLFFDEGDVLTHYGATFSSHRTQYAMPWEDIHEESDNAAADADRPGLTPQRN